MYEYLCKAINDYYFKNDFFYKFCYRYLWESTTYKERREIIKERILTKKSVFHSYPYRKHKFLQYCNKYYKLFNALTIFTNKCKKLYTNKYDFDTDLSLEPLSSFHSSQLISIIQHGKLYTFTLSDINDLILKNITNSEYMNYKPLITKNPFTNLPFTKANLFNFYIKSKNTNFKLNKLVKTYIESNFDFDYVYYKYFIQIKEQMIKDFIYNMDNDCLFSYVTEMFAVLRYEQKFKHIRINEINPSDKYKKRIVNLSRKLLFHYLLFNSNSNHNLKKYHYELLCKKLVILLSKKPDFWKLKLKRKTKPSHKSNLFSLTLDHQHRLQNNNINSSFSNNIENTVISNNVVISTEIEHINTNITISQEDSKNIQTPSISTETTERNYENTEREIHHPRYTTENPNYNANITFVIDCYLETDIDGEIESQSVIENDETPEFSDSGSTIDFQTQQETSNLFNPDISDDDDYDGDIFSY